MAESRNESLSDESASGTHFFERNEVHVYAENFQEALLSTTKICEVISQGFLQLINIVSAVATRGKIFWEPLNENMAKIADISPSSD